MTMPLTNRMAATGLLVFGGVLLLIASVTSISPWPHLDRAAGPVLIAAAFTLPNLSPGRLRSVFLCIAVLLGTLAALSPFWGMPPAQLTTDYDAFQLWPRAAAALAAGLSLTFIPDTEPSGPTDILIGSGLTTLTLSGAASFGSPEMVETLARGPVHILLLAAAGAVTSAIVRGVIVGFTPQTRGFTLGLVGLLPVLGFLGTVLGIISALRSLPALFGDGDTVDRNVLDLLLSGLATAFETTLIGLAAAALATFVLNLVDPKNA